MTTQKELLQRLAGMAEGWSDTYDSPGKRLRRGRVFSARAVEDGIPTGETSPSEQASAFVREHGMESLLELDPPVLEIVDMRYLSKRALPETGVDVDEPETPTGTKTDEVLLAVDRENLRAHLNPRRNPAAASASVRQ